MNNKLFWRGVEPCVIARAILDPNNLKPSNLKPFNLKPFNLKIL